MPNARLFVVMIAISAAGVLAMSDAALAKKKISYEEAWKLCTTEVNKNVPGDQTGHRASVGASCMKKYGYRLKR